MRARIVSIESGENWDDKERRVKIKFEDASFAYNEIRVPESALGLVGVELDMILDLEVSVVRPSVSQAEKAWAANAQTDAKGRLA